jgi:hypothetical protein
LIEDHDVGAALLGDVEERAEGALVIDEGTVADDGAVRQRGDRALEVEHLGERDPDDLPSPRREEFPQLFDGRRASAAAAADVRGASHLEHVTAVEGSPRDALRVVTELAHGLARRGDLRAASGLSRAGDDRELTEHDDRVLDEDRIGEGVIRCDLDRRPAVRVQGSDVCRPLAARAVNVDRLPVDEADAAAGQRRGGAAHEGERRERANGHGRYLLRCARRPAGRCQ